MRRSGFLGMIQEEFRLLMKNELADPQLSPAEKFDLLDRHEKGSLTVEDFKEYCWVIDRKSVV